MGGTGEEEEAEEEELDEDGNPKPAKETIFLAGRLYREDTIIKAPKAAQSSIATSN